jgi:AcrR family transcriptional regulator
MDKKQNILDAALVLFAERGFHGTSVAEIAESAHVGAGTIYRYFKDKEELVNALFRYWKHRMAEAVTEGLDETLSPRRLFHEWWVRMTKFSRENPNVVMFLEFHHHAPYLDDESRRITREIEDRFFSFLELCRAQQITRDAPPALLMAVLIGAFVRVEKVRTAGLLEASPEIDLLLEEMCWEAVRR